MIYIVKIGSKEYEVEVEKGQANIINTTTVIASNMPAPAPVVAAPAPASAPVPTPSSAVIAEGRAVKAPLPGVILAIKATAGSIVKKGEVLLIIEAMKMENEILAPVDCVVTQVLVAKGGAVATDDTLVIIR